MPPIRDFIDTRPFESLVLAVLLALTASQVLRWIRSGLNGALSHVPGPWYTRWTKMPADYYWITGHRPKYVLGLHQKFGPIVRVGPDEVDIADLDGVKQIHRIGGGFVKTPFYQRLAVKGARNLFNVTDVDYHTRHRRLLAAPMTAAALAKSETMIREKVDLTVQRMGEEYNSRGCTDVANWWLFMATDVIGELCFGDSFRMLEQGKENQYISDLKTVGRIQGIIGISPWIMTVGNFLRLPMLRKMDQSFTRLQQYGSTSIERYQRALQADPVNTKPTVFTKLLNKAEEDGLHPHEIRDEAQGFIVAGSDTTANSLTWLVWLVCGHEHVRAELLSSLHTLPEGYTDEHLRGLPYLAQVIEETLRLYGAAPGALPRTVPEGGLECGGYHIPPGSTVSTQAWTLHRDPNTFPNPLKFDPSRWSNSSKEMKAAFTAFGAGSRICIGLHLARMEMRHATARFFLAYPNAKMSKMEGMSDEDMEPLHFFLMFPRKKRCLMQLF
ncbi:cytochrome P450 [Aspergillus insuetus]